MRKPDVKKRIERLASEIKLHRYLYYNKEPRITDQEYDALVYSLTQLDPENEVLKQVGAPPDEDSGWPKATHNLSQMRSLQNAMNIEEYEKWLGTIGRPQGRCCVCEDKFDGLSIELYYEVGILCQGLTRGNGHIGDDITINVRKMQFVQSELNEKITCSLRGEIMLFKKDFDAINDELITAGKKPFANPRNAAAGICKRFDGKWSDKLRVVLYDIVSPDVTFTWETEKMDYISKKLDLVTANYKLLTPKGVIQLRQQYTDSIRDTLPYFIDGIVVKLNSIQAQKTYGFTPTGDPKWATAFKFDPRGVAATILDIVATVGRTGVIVPNAVIEPVNIEGSTVKAATLHNFEEVKRLGVGIGDIVLLYKAGEIIPKVQKVITSAGKPYSIPTVCPKCNGPVEIDGANLWCNSDSCEGKDFRKIRHWADVLKKRAGLENIGESTIEQLYLKGLVKDPADFYTLTVETISSLERSGEKSAKKIASGFEKCKELDIVTYLAALAIPSLGPTMAELIAEEYDLFALMEEVTEEDLAKISGIGPQRAKDILEGLEQRRELIEKLTKLGVCVKVRQKTEVTLVSNKLEGKSFQVTGALSRINPDTKKPYNRDEWYEIVQSNGGTISRVNKTLNYLLATRSSSNKIKKAADLGITVINEETFWQMVD